MNLLGTKLVVLSACETGIGDVTYGEGVAGLNQAFMRAGAKGVVMSLWRVPDVATSELMASLYEAMAKGLSPGDALRAAQLQFIHQKSHPLAWAAFIYNG
jgi:CHAT domain-containing protein